MLNETRMEWWETSILVALPFVIGLLLAYTLYWLLS
jgi:hypothetical protein